MRGKGGGKGYGLPNKKGGGGKGIWSSGTAGPECLRNPAKDVDPTAAGRPGGAPQPPAPEHSNPNGGVGDRQQQQPPTTAAPIHSGSWVCLRFVKSAHQTHTHTGTRTPLLLTPDCYSTIHLCSATPCRPRRTCQHLSRCACIPSATP